MTITTRRVEPDERCDCGHTIDVHNHSGCLEPPFEPYCPCTKTPAEIRRDLHPRWHITRDISPGPYPWVVQCPAWFRTSPHRKRNHETFCERCDTFPTHALALAYVQSQLANAREVSRHVSAAGHPA